jgi:hypothetical protein
VAWGLRSPLEAIDAGGVSTDRQSLVQQRDRLNATGVDQIFDDRRSGSVMIARA